MSWDLNQDELRDKFNALPTTQTPDVGLGFNFVEGAGKMAMKIAAESARAVQFAGAVVPMYQDWMTDKRKAQGIGKESEVKTVAATERYFKAMADGPLQSAVDYWTPKPFEVGTAGEVIGSLLGMMPLIMAGPAGPSMAVGATMLSQGQNLVDQGAPAGKAAAVGTVQGLGLGLGIMAPILGRTLLERVLVGGAGFNVVQGMVTSSVSGAILKGEKGAENYDPFSTKEIGINALSGAMFGVGAHLIPAQRAQGEAAWKAISEFLGDPTPTQKAAAAILLDRMHMTTDTLPGIPESPADREVHIQRMAQAINDLANDRPVDVENIVNDVPRETPTIDAAHAAVEELNALNPQLNGALRVEVLSDAEMASRPVNEEAGLVGEVMAGHNGSTINLRSGSKLHAVMEEVRHMIDMLLGGNAHSKWLDADADLKQRAVEFLAERRAAGDLAPNARMTDAREIMQALLDQFFRNPQKLEQALPEMYRALMANGADKYSPILDKLQKAQDDQGSPAVKESLTVDQLPDAGNMVDVQTSNQPRYNPDLARIEQDQAIKEAIQEHAKTVAAEEGIPQIPERKTIAQTIEEQLVQAGRPAEEAKAGATLWQAFFDTTASRYGRTGQELFDRYMKGITGELTSEAMLAQKSLLDKMKDMQPQVESAKAAMDKIIQDQRELEGLRAAMRDPLTGKIYTGWSHQGAIATVPQWKPGMPTDGPEFGTWGRLNAEWDRGTDNTGFIDRDGKFISRTEAEKRWNVLTMEDVRDAKKKNGTLFQGAVPWYHSELERQIGTAKMGAASPKDWKNYIKGLSNKGVKADEVKWTGLEEWLDLQQGKITKEQIQQYMKDGGVKVEETTLGDFDQVKFEIVDDGVDPDKYRYSLMVNGVEENRFTSREAAEEEVDILKNDPQTRRLYKGMVGSIDTKFGQWQLPGGENYRELLLTLPTGRESFNDAAQRMFGKSYDKLDPRDQIEVRQEVAGDAAPTFNSSHFDQPNILAHIRFNERTDADGKRVLFIEEIQSDWAQKGKKEGFNVKPEIVEKKVGDRTVYQVISRGEVFSEETTRATAELVAAEENNHLNGVPSAPFVGKTEAWVGLSLKRMIRYASENGFDKIAWANGEQQAARYDLSKQIKEIEYIKRGDLYELGITQNNGDGLSLPKKEFTAAELEDVVGKEVAKKIVEGEGKHYRGHEGRTLEGLDLKVGGEGMKAFYDRIVPNVANDVLRRLDPAPSHAVSNKAVPMQVVGNGLPADAQALRDFSGAESFIAKGFDGLNAADKRVVKQHMLTIGKNPQVLDAVIRFVPVDVMNVLRREQLSPEAFFHDPAMMSNRAGAIKTGNDVAAFGDVASSLVSAVARAATEHPAAFVNERGVAREGRAALDTMVGSHDGTPDSNVGLEAGGATTSPASSIVRAKVEKVNIPGLGEQPGFDITPSMREKAMDTQALFQPGVPQTETANFKAWSNDAPLITSDAAETHDFKTGQKIVVEAYHGTQRPDRVGEKFLKKRATSGPMAFHTSSPELASGYAKGKADTSLAGENQNYEAWFKFKPKGMRSAVDLDRAWYHLSAEERARIAEKLPHVTDMDAEGNTQDTYRVGGAEEYGLSGKDHWDYEIKQARGNVLKAAKEIWLNSGSLFNSEVEFMQVLKLGEFPVKDLSFDDPHGAYPFVYKNYIQMESPLVTSDIPQSVMDALNQAAKRDRSRPKLGGADAWDKNNRTMKDWVEVLNSADAKHAWTSIPDKVTATLKELGFDGIVDWSGKGGGNPHPVYIPFEETQVKSAIGNKGKFSRDTNNIMRQEGERGALQFDQQGKMAIALLKSADPSTFLHESGHFFLEVTNDLAGQPDAPAAMKQDMQTLYSWFGLKDADTWNNMTLDEKRPYHEQFARGFERYLRDGKAPTPVLKGLFQRFRDWLKAVYQSASQLNVEVSDQVRAVMDRMLAEPQRTEAPPEATRSATPPPPRGGVGEPMGEASVLTEVQQVREDIMAAEHTARQRWGDAIIDALYEKYAPHLEDAGQLRGMSAIMESLAEDAKPAYLMKTMGPRPKEPQSLIAAIKELGGINTSMRSDIAGPDKKGVPVSLFRKAGKNVDELALLLQEKGFLNEADIANESDNGGINKLMEMIQDEIAGSKHYSERDATQAAALREHDQFMESIDGKGESASTHFTPEEWATIQREVIAEGLAPTAKNVVDADAVSIAMQIDEARVERAAITAADDFDFMAEVREIIDGYKPQQDATAAERSAPAAAKPGTTSQAGQEANAPGADRNAGNQGVIAQQALRMVAENPELPIATGVDAQGNTTYQKASEYLAEAKAMADLKRQDVSLFELAAQCLLGGGR